ncbi:Validoxylamine A glucosyltransferase [Candidatus Brocadiaceae bacterium]|nr:Validoxylamine A glucosyltransferase [Candidatus Brocadiaceae bacterium]
MSKISVVMPAFNKSLELPSVLSAFSRQSLSRDYYEVIVVDDGSTDGTPGILQEFSGVLNLKTIRLERSADGTSQAYRARNIGVQRASAPIIVITDSDIIPSYEFLRYHLESHISGNDIAVLAYTYAVSLSPLLWAERVGDVRRWDFTCRDELFALAQNQPNIRDQRDKRFSAVADDIMALPLPWTYFWSHNVSMSRDKLLSLGLFDENFRRSGDFDLGYRLVSSGTQLKFSRQAEAFHYPHARDYSEDLRFDRQGEYYLLSKYPNVAVETLVAFGCYEASPTFPEVVCAVDRVHSSVTDLEACERAYTDITYDEHNEQALVMGCVNGQILEHLRVDLGTDVNSEKIGMCRRFYPQKTLLELIGIAIPFADSSLSTIIVTDFWRLMPPKILLAQIKEAMRASRRVLFLLNTRSSVGGDPSDAEQRLQKCGFAFSRRHISLRLEMFDFAVNNIGE